MTTETQSAPSLTRARVFHTWMPLAASWLLMGVELPVVSAVLGRLPEPEVSLAAYGSVIFPLALLIESPIIMLLAASTALCKDATTYRQVRRFMLAAGTALTVLHVAVAFTPLFDLIVRHLIRVPPEVVEPARLGFRIMTPWTFAIAYRRFQQGVLIRFGRSRVVGWGTLVRMLSGGAVLLWGLVQGVPYGVAVGATASALGVVVEAVFIGALVRPVVRGPLRGAAPAATRLTVTSFVRFYVPLSLTSLLGLLVPPIGATGMSRMPMPLESLAVWPTISSLVFLLRGMGIAFNEVVVALIDDVGSTPVLRWFRNRLALANGTVLAVVATTAVADIWFTHAMSLPEPLALLARSALWIGIPLPVFAVLQSWHQGILVHAHRTRAIPEAVLASVCTMGAIMAAGVVWSGLAGIRVALFAIVCGQLVQVVWLAARSRSSRAQLDDRDRHAAAQPQAQG